MHAWVCGCVCQSKHDIIYILFFFIYLLKVVGMVVDLEVGRAVVRVEAAKRRLWQANIGFTGALRMHGPQEITECFRIMQVVQSGCESKAKCGI